MSPTRRTLLAPSGLALVGLLAGCAGATPPRADGGGNDDGVTVSVAAVDDAPDLPVRPSVAVTREAATAEHPPQLRTTVENTTDEPVTVGEGRTVHFAYVTSDEGDLILLPTETDTSYPVDPGCWRLTDGIAVTEEYRTLDVDAGEESTRLLDLYATPDGAGCLPTGRFRFETTVAVVTAEGEMQASATWGFSLRLE